jgi:HlyD family secretion protein
MTRKTKIAVAAVVAVLATGGGIAGITARPDSGIAVRAEAVEARGLESVVRASGWIQPRMSVDVRPDIMGRVTGLYVQEGDAVTRGQVLLRIDPTQYEGAVARGRAGVSESLAREAQARASLLQAQHALRRATEMRAADVSLMSSQQYEEVETQASVQKALHEAAMHGVEIARAMLREAQGQLAKSVIRAPIDGVVTRLNIEEGETAIVGTMNNPGSLLVTISDLSGMEAVVRADETDVPGLTLGDSTVLTIDAFPRRRFAGRVTKISHSSTLPPQSRGFAQQSQAVDFEVVITLDDPPAGIRPDLSATAEIITSRREGALAIPIIALTVRERNDLGDDLDLDLSPAQEAALSGFSPEGDDVEGVFVIRDGKARFTMVRVGITGREHFEVLAGLAAGDSVVAGPYEAVRRLTDGAAVRVLPVGGKTGSTTPTPE